MSRPVPILMLACCLLSACASGQQPMLVQAAPQIQPIKVPPQASLTTPPQTLPQPTSGHPLDLELNHRQVALAYHQLAARYCALLLTLEIEHRECLPYLRDPDGKHAEPSRDRR